MGRLNRFGKIIGAASLSVAALLLNACHSDSNPAPVQTLDEKKVIRITSKLDKEGALLGHMMVQVLEGNGIPTSSQLQMGSSKIVRLALLSNQVDMYPEYTGNGAVMFNSENNPVWKDAHAAYALVKKLDYEANKIVWLAPAPANNTWVIAVRSDLAESNKLNSVEDLAHYINHGGFFKFATSTEFIERNNALALFEKTYQFKLKTDQFLPMAGGDSGDFVEAAKEQRFGANAALVYATDGATFDPGLVILADNKGAEPVFQPTPIIREEALKQYPQIETLLNPVFDSLDTETMKRLNRQVSAQGISPEETARTYLRSKGFLKQ